LRTSAAASSRFGGIFDYATKRERLEEVTRELESPTVWDDPARAQELGRERARLDTIVSGIDTLTGSLTDGNELLQMAIADDDEETALSVVADVARLDGQISKLEFQRMFSGKMDSTNAFVDIQAGAGGTEAQDWAEMLLRMYLRWCESRGWQTELMEVSGGDVAGIKSATFRVEGDYAYGQHVNKTESAVRITHIPTNTVVACQTGRSQHANRATAMKMLAAKLYELEVQKRNVERDALEATKSDIGWGSQIRNYVLDQSRIKDLRTGIERTDTQKVLDGDLDDFIEASLKSGLEAGSKRSDA
jgi:protein subunit release factor B